MKRHRVVVTRYGGPDVLEEDGDTLLTNPVIDQAALYGPAKKSAWSRSDIALGQSR